MILQTLRSHRTSTGAIGLLLIATLGGAALNFAVQVLLARALGAQQFGTFSAALAMAALLAPLAGFGLGGYWLNVYGREGWGAQRWLPASFRFLAMSTTGVALCLIMWAWLGPNDLLTALLLSILTIHVIGQSAVMLMHTKYQLEGRQSSLAMWQFVPHLLRFIGIGVLILVMGKEAFSAVHASIVFATTALFLITISICEMRRMIDGRLALEGHTDNLLSEDKSFRPGYKSVMSGTWPFGLASIFYLIYFQSDIILIKYLVNETAAGTYNVAFVIMAAVYLFPSVLYQKFLLPKLHRWAHHDPVTFSRTYRIGNIAMALIGLCAMILLWLLVPPLLPWLFGAEYRASVDLLLILAIAAPFRFVATSAGSVLTVRDNIRVKVRLMGIAALVNVSLNLLLIPSHGASGAAVATVISDVLLCGLYLLLSRRFIAEFQTLWRTNDTLSERADFESH